MLEIALFGEPRFTHDGRSHAFAAPPKTLPLLAYLLLHRNVTVARDSLCGLLWPDNDEETARANLRRHLHYVRKALPPGEWLRIDGRSLQWNPQAPFRLDVAEFEQQSKMAQMRPLAIKTYTADLYPSCEEEWIYFDRERLRNMQIGNLASLAQDAERARDHVAAAAYAHALLEIEPWREDAVRILMRARMQSGDRAGALNVYERFSARLDEEMGVDPMDETRALFEGFAGQENPVQLPHARPHTLVGRAGELEALLVQWRSATNGRGTLTLVGGEAGVGKTALLQALADEVRASNGVVLSGAVLAQGDAPYGAVVRALSHADLDERIRKANPLPLGARLGDTGERGVFFSSVATALRSICAQAPLLLCIEDLHWGGGDTIALIEFLERRLRDAQVFIACSYRDDAVAPDHPLRALRRVLATSHGSNAHVALNTLTLSDAERIVRRRLGENAEAATYESLYQRTHGNAFFLTELLENIAAGHRDDVPESIRDLVEERSERLSSNARDLIIRLAVAGTVISADLIVALSETDESARTRALDELVRARFLRTDAGSAAPTYAFIHDVVRESMYDGIPAERRSKLHRQTARAMERIASAQYAAIAGHHERANDFEAAARVYVLAAGQALDLFANDDAERFSRKALALHDDDCELAMTALEHLYLVYNRRGDRSSQANVVKEMESVAARSENPLHACKATYHRLARAFYENDSATMAALLPRLAAQIPDMPIWQARLRSFTSTYELLNGNLDAAWEHAHAALQLCHAAGNPYGELFCYTHLLELCDGRTRPFEALLESARALERELDHPDATFLLANAEANLFLHVDRTQCKYSAMRIMEAGERTGDQVYTAIGHMYLAAVATYRFEPQAALEHFSAANSGIEGSGRIAELARLLRFRGLFYYSIGDVERGLEDSLAALDFARAGRAFDLIAVAAGNAVYGLTLCGRFIDAIRLAEQASAELEGVRHHYFSIHHLMLSYGLALAATGRFDEAIPRMQVSYEEHDVRGLKLHAAWTGTSLAYELLRAGRPQEARPYIEHFLKVLPDMVDEGWMPQAGLWHAAQVLRALGDQEKATGLLERAADIVATRQGALPFEEQQQRFVAQPLNRQILRAHGEGVWPTL